MSVAQRRGMHIAVIDDDPDMLGYLRALLSSHHDVSTFATSAAALAALPFIDPALVLLDVELGSGCDGIDLLRRLRDFPALAKIPVVAVTAHGSLAERSRMLAVGCVDFIAKPIRDDGLVLAIVQDCLNGTHTPPMYDVFDEPTWPERPLRLLQ